MHITKVTVSASEIRFLRKIIKNYIYTQDTLVFQGVYRDSTYRLFYSVAFYWRAN